MIEFCGPCRFSRGGDFWFDPWDGRTNTLQRTPGGKLNCSGRSKVGNSNPSASDSVRIRANLSVYCRKLCLQCFRL